MPLTRDRARRFAEILYREFCEEGHFDIVLPVADLHIVSDIFEKELSCRTSVDENGRRLTIYCPAG